MFYVYKCKSVLWNVDSIATFACKRPHSVYMLSLRGDEVKNVDRVLQQMTDLLTEQGKTQSSLCDYLGIRSDMYSRWKKGESRSYMFDIGRIADFFGVSADYILCRTKQEVSASTLTAAESRLLSRFRALLDKKHLWLLQGIGFLEEDFDKNLKFESEL